MTLDSLREMTGREVAVTDWVAITQERIDRFAEATEDRQWIHLDRDRAERESPYGTTIAHGFLTLSMLSHFSRGLLPADGVRMRVNYGLNRVRFPAPVRAGTKIRARFVLQAVKDFEEGSDLTFGVTIESQSTESQGMEGESEEKPCCVAEWVVRYIREASVTLL